jgi:uncharacterized protein (TIGR03118 family)
MKFPYYFWSNKAAANPQRPYRPVLECLEDRCLLSGGFAQVNLASDVPGLARVTDPNLVNPWGIAFSPTGPFWFANNGSGVSDLLDGRGQPVPLVVTVPSPLRSGGTPTGTVFNGGSGFAISENGVSAPSRFLFSTEDGTISGWTAVVDPTRALLAVDNSSTGAVYKGLALAWDQAGRSLLYAADFGRGTIDVFDQDFKPVGPPGSFQDANLPDGFAPFNIQNINDLLFVTYARQDEARHDEVAGAGQGFIDVYDIGGNLVRRFASQGALNAPWGLALAPAGFGPFGASLLIGNVGDGHINAYDTASGGFLGPLADDNDVPLAIPTLWALTFGNGHEGGATDTLFFAAGVNYEQHGLFGAIQAPQRKGADTAGPGPFDPDAPGEAGDYPLPPRNGPALQETGADARLATAVLLPLTESSLVLVPTLTTSVQPKPRAETPAPTAPVAAISLQGPGVTALTASGTTLLLPTADDFLPPRHTENSLLALSTFLDLNPAEILPEEPASGQRPDTDLPLSLFSSPRREEGNALAGPGDAVAASLLAEPHRETAENRSAMIGVGDQESAIDEEQPNSSSPTDRVAGRGGVASPNHGSRIGLIQNLLVAVGIPVSWLVLFVRARRFENESQPMLGEQL